MALLQLDNYIATYRKRSGLTQQEVAMLLGARSGTEISRFESNRRTPALRTALALGIIFQVEMDRLYAGKRERLRRQIERRVRRFHSRLLNDQETPKGRPSAERKAKLRWLATRQAK